MIIINIKMDKQAVQCTIRDGSGILINIIMTEINLIDTMFNQVAQCAGCNVYEPWAAMVIGAGAAFVYLCIHTLMIRWWIRVTVMLVLLKLMVLFMQWLWFGSRSVSLNQC